MSDTTTAPIEDKSRTEKKWVWRGLVLVALLLILFAVARPFVQNYHAIQHFKGTGGYVRLEPGKLLKTLPKDWEFWLRGHVAEEWFFAFEEVTDLNFKFDSVSDSDLFYLKNMTNLDFLFLDSTHVTDAGIVYIKGLTNLKILSLNNTDMTDTGLLQLKGMTNLHALKLSNTHVTDVGLFHLKHMTNLENLLLYGTQVTDAGLFHLKGMTNLEYLDLTNTQVTDAGVEKLQKALPKCEIVVSYLGVPVP